MFWLKGKLKQNVLHGQNTLVCSLFLIPNFQIKSLQAIFNGPDTFVVSPVDNFKPTTARSEPLLHQREQYRRSRPVDPHTLAGRLQEKREKMAKTREHKYLDTTLLQYQKFVS